jgi:hypothetical protein
VLSTATSFDAVEQYMYVSQTRRLSRQFAPCFYHSATSLHDTPRAEKQQSRSFAHSKEYMYINRISSPFEETSFALKSVGILHAARTNNLLTADQHTATAKIFKPHFCCWPRSKCLANDEPCVTALTTMVDSERVQDMAACTESVRNSSFSMHLCVTWTKSQLHH